MPSVDIQRQLSVPETQAREAAAAILSEIAASKDPWTDFALHLDLRDLGLPDVGYVAIPIALSGPRAAAAPAFRLDFSLKAKHGADAFPTLDGTLHVEPAKPSASILRLRGSYELPMRNLGSILDAVLGRGAAQKTLENFVDDLANGIVARVERREIAGARYRMLFNRP